LDSEIPSGCRLLQTFPNPFNRSTRVIFHVPKKEWVKLTVFNIVGQKVATLVEGQFEKGTHHLTWNAERVPGGIYLIRMTAGEEHTAIKVVFSK
jgi:hypothetical protein